MELQLKRIRESKKVSQKQMAAMLSERLGKEIKTRTYGSWERQEVTMDLEQAYYCATVLGCTLNDIVGMKSEGAVTGDERKLVDSYRRMDESNRASLMDTASTFAVAAELKKDGAGRAAAMVGDDVRNG